jgi:nickel-dependent lactate racemase
MELRLRTAAWHGDHVLDLEVPETWEVSIHAPATGPPLSADEIERRIASPVDQPPIRKLCAGRTRPLIIVDDLNRPTPAADVLPALLRQFTDVGIPTGNITVLIGSGTHAPTNPEGAAKKVGAAVMESCRVRIHDCEENVVKVGRTSFGTPVTVSRDVVQSDFLVSVGGVYPNYTAGFGGGSKAVLGVLGVRSIAALHFGHPSSGRGVQSAETSFRRDLDEIAALLGLETGVLVAVDADRRIVGLTCGDPRALYSGYLSSTKDAFRAPRPDANTRIVISNAYPNDLSLTFVQMKGIAPLGAAPPGASRIVVASCSEGLGFHGLFPFMNAPRFHRVKMLRHRIAANLHEPRAFAGKVLARLTRRRTRRGSGGRPAAPGLLTWLYCPSPEAAASLPSNIPGIRTSSSWSEIVRAVNAEQGSDGGLQTIVYSAAPLQWFE